MFVTKAVGILGCIRYAQTATLLRYKEVSMLRGFI